MCFNIDLSSWRLVLEFFLREDVSHCKALLLRTFLGFDLRLVRLILVSVFCSSPGPLVNFRLRTNLYVRFDSLDFVFSAWAWFSHSSPLYPLTLVICVCLMLLFVTSSEFFTVWTLFFISATCFSSTWIPRDFFTRFCCSAMATTLRWAACSWIHHSASQDSCRSWLYRKPVASLRPVRTRLAQTGWPLGRPSLISFGSCSHHRSSGVQLPLPRRIPSRTTRGARCPAFFVVCILFLSVSSLSCRLGFPLSLNNLLDHNIHLMFFVLRNPSLQSTWLLRSVTVCRPLCCFCVASFFNAASFYSSTSISSSISTWCSLAFSATFNSLFCCHVSMTFSILLSRHLSIFFLRDIVLLERLGLQLLFQFFWFSTVAGYALFACCWLCSSGLLLAMLFCHFVPLSEILVDLLLVVVQVLRLCAPFRQSGFAFFVDVFSSLGPLSVFWRRLLQHHFVVSYCSEVRFRHLQRHYSACATSWSLVRGKCSGPCTKKNWEIYNLPKNQTRTIRQWIVRRAKEDQGLSKIDWHTDPWQRTTLLTDKAVQWPTAKVHVFSVSTLCWVQRRIAK